MAYQDPNDPLKQQQPVNPAAMTNAVGGDASSKVTGLAGGGAVDPGAYTNNYDPNQQKTQQYETGGGYGAAQTNTQNPDAQTNTQPTGQLQPPGVTDAAAGAGGWVPQVQNGMSGYFNPATSQWVPGDHPLATQAGNPSVNPNGGQPTPGAPGSPAPGGPGQAGGVPPPTQYTSTPDMQAVQRQTILDGLARSQQPVSVNDANIKAQLDPFAAAQERTRRQAESEAAEQASTSGLGSSGALDATKRAAQERAGQATGLQAADLVGRELQSKRDELQNFLKINAATIDADQARMLQKQLADLDAQIRRENIASSSALGNRELDIRSDLGNKGINNDIMRLLLQNKQFGQDLGFRIGDAEAGYNRDSILAMLGG